MGGLPPPPGLLHLLEGGVADCSHFPGCGPKSPQRPQPGKWEQPSIIISPRKLSGVGTRTSSQTGALVAIPEDGAENQQTGIALADVEKRWSKRDEAFGDRASAEPLDPRRRIDSSRPPEQPVAPVLGRSSPGGTTMIQPGNIQPDDLSELDLSFRTGGSFFSAITAPTTPRSPAAVMDVFLFNPEGASATDPEPDDFKGTIQKGKEEDPEMEVPVNLHLGIFGGFRRSASSDSGAVVVPEDFSSSEEETQPAAGDADRRVNPNERKMKKKSRRRAASASPAGAPGAQSRRRGRGLLRSMLSSDSGPRPLPVDSGGDGPRSSPVFSTISRRSRRSSLIGSYAPSGARKPYRSSGGRAVRSLSPRLLENVRCWQGRSWNGVGPDTPRTAHKKLLRSKMVFGRAVVNEKTRLSGGLEPQPINHQRDCSATSFLTGGSRPQGAKVVETTVVETDSRSFAHFLHKIKRTGSVGLSSNDPGAKTSCEKKRLSSNDPGAKQGACSSPRRNGHNKDLLIGSAKHRTLKEQQMADLDEGVGAARVREWLRTPGALKPSVRELRRGMFLVGLLEGKGTLFSKE